MNLRDLHYFLAVAATRNFKRAAEKCHVSQPTLSMQIKKLENELNVQLFERTNKNVMVTTTGQRLRDVAERIVQEEESLRRIARLARDPYAGDFRLGAMPTLASYVFPTFAPVVTTAFPKLNLLLVEEKTERLLDQLKNGLLDAALLALPVEAPDVTSTPLFTDPFLLAVGAAHPLAKRKQVHLSDLAGHKLLLLDDGHCLRDQALDVCHAHGADEEKSFRATSLETLRLMVRAPASPLMTLMPKIAVTVPDGVRYIPFAQPSPARTIGLITRKASARKELITPLTRLLVQAAKAF